MTTATDIIAQIQAIADEAASPVSLKISLGDPSGAKVEVEGMSPRLQDPGQAWGSYTVFQTLIEGYSAWSDSVMKAKINEIIAQYNQLRTDYNNGTVPTTSTAISTL